ncbi:DoxX family membrane protein [Nonomuraea mesophila]|uniref:DoxX family membrane protein n=1 Tax=Nonomuraea mesophila TaxID=2530382 RepID=A0A4R5EJ55_9ACTN|nr:DoxX family protein [Nonomuraea mesophila]TDE34400.1 DoxX family membrane protein [Nonomuraea mesophila]
MTADERSPASTAKRTGKAATITAWGLQILLALAMVAAGASKLLAEASAVEMFDDIGAGQSLRLVIGVLEIAGAAGLMIPRLRALAALCLLLLLLGATVVNLTVLGASPLIPLAYAALAAAIVFLRQHELPTRRRT